MKFVVIHHNRRPTQKPIAEAVRGVCGVRRCRPRTPGQAPSFYYERVKAWTLEVKSVERLTELAGKYHKLSIVQGDNSQYDLPMLVFGYPAYD